MRLAKCNGERCGATFPATARFCPRCGRAVDTAARPPREQTKRPMYSRRRPCFPILRIVALCWLASFALRSLTHVATRRSVTAPSPVVVSPALPPPAESFPDVTSLEGFIAWRADHAADHKHDKKFLEAQEVRWTGRLKKSLIPGRFDLIDEMRGKASVRLLPVTADAKDDIRRLDSGARVRIEGVLMDEHSVHVVSVRESRQD